MKMKDKKECCLSVVILNKLGATVANAGGDGGAAIEAYEALLREIVI